MSILGLAHYNFRLSRPLMEDVRRFYLDVVGLQPGPRPPFASFGYWLYAGRSAVLHLTEESAVDPRRIGRDLTFDHVALTATDLDGPLERLRAAGVAFTESTVPFTGRHQVFFRDPAGNGVELILEGDPVG